MANTSNPVNISFLSSPMADIEKILLAETFDGFSLVTKEQEFLLLEDQWNNLWANNKNSSVFQSFNYCYHAWKSILKPLRRKLYCVIKRQNDQIVLIWPLIKYRKLLCSIVRPLGPVAAEYTDPLIDDSINSQQIVHQMWEFLRKSLRSDIINLPFVKCDSLLYQELLTLKTSDVDSDIAPYVSWIPQQTWDEYYKSLSSSYRKVQNKKKRQLMATGTVSFEVIEDKAQYNTLISWLLTEKRKWGNRVNKKGAWIFSDRYKTFLINLSSDQLHIQPFVIYALKLNNIIIALQLAAVGKKHVNWMIAGFDADFSHSSPGIILNEYCLQWAHQHQLNCDFGAGAEENKLFWSKGQTRSLATLQIATSYWGRLALHGWKSKRSLDQKYRMHRLRLKEKNQIV